MLGGFDPVEQVLGEVRELGHLRRLLIGFFNWSGLTAMITDGLEVTRRETWYQSWGPNGDLY